MSLVCHIATSLLLRGNDVDGFIAEMYGGLATELDVDVFFLYRTETADSRLRLAHHRGVSPDTAHNFAWLDIGQVVCGNVAATRHARVIDDVQHCQDAETKLIRELGIVAYACFPLVAQGVLYGTLSLGRRRNGAFVSSDLELMQTVADLVSVAFDRQAQARALLEADQNKDNFLAVLAHELRAPLGSISGAAAILQHSGVDPHRVSQAKAIIERQVRNLARLVSQLTDLAKVKLGKIVLNTRVESVGDIVSDGIELSRPGIDARGHLLTISLPPDPVHVYADRDRLAQVIANLLSNSAKYTPDNGHIALEVAEEHAVVVIRVRDDGIGIASDVLPHIFDLFAQAGEARARDQSGMGIGLALVRSLVEMHGGSIQAHSSGLGMGSEFTIRIPKRNAPASG